MSLHDKIEALRTLSDNWDGYGALAITNEAVDLAQQVADVLDDSWSACPVPDGSVQLELHADGFDSEIEIRKTVTGATRTGTLGQP